MRKRRWVLVLMLILAAANFGGYAIWKLTGTDEKIRNLLLEKARPFLSVGSDIRELKLTLNRVHMKGVVIVPRDRSFLLEIEDMQLGYNLFNLIRYRFNPNKVAHDIILVHPVLIFKKQAFARQQDNAGKNWADYRNTIESFSTIRQITIAEAEIRIEDADGSRISFAGSLDGILFANPLDSALIRLSGNLFSSKNANMELDGRINLLTGAPGHFHLKLDESDPSKNLASLVPGFAEVKGGKIRGECNFDPGTGMRGYVEYERGNFSLKKAPLNFEGVNLRGLFKEDGILFSGSVDQFNGSRLSVEGFIENPLNPRMDVRIRCPRFDVRRFAGSFHPALRNLTSQKGQFQFRVTGSPKNPSVLGSVSADGLKGAGFSFDTFVSDVTLQDSVLTVKGSGQSANGLNLKAETGIRMVKAGSWMKIQASLTGDAGALVPAFIRNRLRAVACDAGLRLEGPAGSIRGEASAKFSVTPSKGRPFDVFSNYFYSSGRCVLSIRSDQGFRVNGEILDPLGKDSRWNMRSNGIQRLGSAVFQEFRYGRADSMEIGGLASGNTAGWTVDLSASDPRRSRFPQVLHLRLDNRKKDKSRRQMDVIGRYMGPEGDELPLAAQFLVTKDETVMQKGEVADFLTASLHIPTGGKSAKWSGAVRVEDLRLEKLHRFFPAMNPFSGKWNGELKVQGPQDRPACRLDLSLRSGIFHDVGPFEGDFAAEWRNGYLGLLDLSVQKNGLPLLVGTIRPDDRDSLGGAIQSGPLVLEELARAVTGKKDMVHGEAMVDIRASGKGFEPVISGKVEIGEGAFKSLSFKSIRAALIDTLFKRNGFRDGSLRIDQGHCVREDGMELGFGGAIPHDASRPMNVAFSGKGNILGFLTEADAFFSKVQSSGEFQIQFAGDPGLPVMKSGWIRLDDGKLSFASTLGPIEKIRGEARLSEGDSILQILALTGNMRGGRFSITGRRPEPAQAELRPIRFARPAINLGILSLSTGSKGIPLHLPGLMAEGEEGWIAFSGLNKGEGFSVTGPVDSPGLQGMVTVSDNQLTYPFLSVGSGSEKSGLERLLENTRWNVNVIPKKGVHYIRDIESAAGNIYVDLQLQDGFGSFNIDGRLSDDSFRVWGSLVSVEGNIEVLDRYFRPERIIFEYPKGGTPIFSGRAYTTVVDSMGVSSTVWLNLVSVDRETGLEEKAGPWSRVQFRFSTDNPNLGRNEADLLAAIGYSEGNIKNRAYDALGIQVENRLFRPIFKPLERGLRKYLGFDMVKFSSMFSRNIFEQQTAETPIFDPKLLLRNSKVTLGKSFAPGLMLVYTGEVQNDYRYVYPMHGIGLRHALAVEYAIKPELMLELEYTYDSQLLVQRREDKRIWLRHVFPF
jgi:hypothetical protein